MTARTPFARVRSLLDRYSSDEAGRHICPVCDEFELHLTVNGAGQVMVECAGGCPPRHIVPVILDLAALFGVPVSPTDLADSEGGAK